MNFPTKLAELLKKDDFCDTMPCVNYTEDKWTERLHKCLLFNGYDSELTAHLRGKQTEDSWKPRIPKGASSKCLLFQGAPDIIIKVKKEGALHMDSQVDGVVESQDVEDEGSPRSDTSNTSNTSGRFQMGHQVICTPYTDDSYLSEKVGELMAALHNLLVCQALRKYVRKSNVDSLEAHGLFIHRSIGVAHVEVTLSKGPIQIHAIQLYDGVLSQELHYFTEGLHYHNKVNLKGTLLDMNHITTLRIQSMNTVIC